MSIASQCNSDSATAETDPGNSAEWPVTSIRQSAMRASAWTVGGYGATQCIRLANSIVLSYFLVPDAFGIMALINIFLQGLTMSSEMGLGASIIQHRDGLQPRFLDTAWTLQMVRGVVVSALSIVLSWPMARFYEEPKLLVLIPVAALIPVMDGLAATAVYTVQRTLQVHKLTMMELVAQICGAVVMCGWAIVHPTVWALVVGTAVAALVRSAGSHLFLSMHINRVRWDRAAVSDIVAFGKWILVGTMIAFAALQIDRVALGKLTDMQTLGLYSIALAIAQLPYMVIVRLTYHVLHPVLSELERRSTAEMKQRFFRIRAVMLLVGLAMLLMVYAGAPLFFRLVYHTNFHAAGNYAKLLCLVSWTLVLAETVTRPLMVVGDSRSLAIYNLVRFLATIAAGLAGYSWWQIEGFVLGVAVGVLCGHVVLLLHLAWHQMNRPGQDIGTTCLFLALIAIVEIVQRQADRLAPGAGDIAAMGLAAIASCVILGCAAASMRQQRLTV